VVSVVSVSITLVSLNKRAKQEKKTRIIEKKLLEICTDTDTFRASNSVQLIPQWNERRLMGTDC